VADAAALGGGGVDVGVLARFPRKRALVRECRHDGRMGADGTGAGEGAV
jgi:hypothetical protein